jgi:dimethylargininase
VNGTLVMPSSFPATRAVLERAGFQCRALDLSELQKAEGGPTCLSILIKT